MRAVLALVPLLSVVFSDASPPRGRHVSKLRQEPQPDFIWGAATASYQIEGSPRADGKQPSVWDDYAKKTRHKIKRDHNGDNADEDYIYFFNKTIPMIKDLGAKYYRMSIAWTRILKDQTAENPAGVENEAGIKHYKDIFAALKAEGIKPVVTMWHWDTPLSLEKNYKGFLNREQMPIFFEEYARTLLKHYGDDVHYWITLNEPLTVAQQGYSGAGIHAPGRCSDRSKCLKGDSQKEPYQAGHTMILAHAHAVKVIREHATADQMTYGIALNGDYCLPHDPNSELDKKAAERCMEFQSAWFFDPIWKGDYPHSMKTMLGDRLPKFTAEEKALVQGAHNGVYFQNIYTGIYARHKEGNAGMCGPHCDANVAVGKEDVNGKPIGKKSEANGWLYRYPEGIRKYQTWISKRYQKDGQGVAIIVSENGWADRDDSSQMKAENTPSLINDVDRCNYHREYILHMSYGVNIDGNRVLGYFPWSLMDNFEWADGYTARFGLTHVNWKTQERTPKMSFKWMSKYVYPRTELPHQGQLNKCDPTEFGFAPKKLKVKGTQSMARQPEEVDHTPWIKEVY